jgi:hypothetical protein
MARLKLIPGLLNTLQMFDDEAIGRDVIAIDDETVGVHDDVTAVDLQIDRRPLRSSTADAKKHIMQGNGIPLVTCRTHPPARSPGAPANSPCRRQTGDQR